MLDQAKLGKVFKLYRKIRNESIESVAAQTGFSEGTLKGIESGKGCLKLSTFNILCLYLGINPPDIFENIISDDILVLNEIIGRIEKKINRYDYDEMLIEIEKLERLLASSRLTRYYDFNSTIQYYYLLHASINGDFEIVLKDLKKLMSVSSSLNNIPKTVTSVDFSRLKILLANTYSSLNNINEAIKIETELINTVDDPTILIKTRINNAKNYYAIKDYCKTYELTLENIKFMFINSVPDRLYSSYWMKGICEVHLNKEFRQSLIHSVHAAHYSGLYEQRDKLKESSLNYFDLEIQLPE